MNTNPNTLSNEEAAAKLDQLASLQSEWAEALRMGAEALRARANSDSAERMMVAVATVFGEFSREEQELRNWCRRFTKWKLCMSYNDSYFGEPAGELKAIAHEIDRILPAVPVPAAPQPQGESNESAPS